MRARHSCAPRACNGQRATTRDVRETCYAHHVTVWTHGEAGPYQLLSISYTMHYIRVDGITPQH
jgi:hypothetical protein